MSASPSVTPRAAGHAAAGQGVRGALVPALDRALTLLDRMAQLREPMSLARLSSELALPKSSVHGLCNTLLQHGYLRRQHDGAFRLGPRVMTLAEAFVASTGVAQEFNALWPDEAAAPEETVILSVLHGREVVYIAARQGTRPLGLAFRVGMRLPAWLAATGKAMLAWQTPEAVQALLGSEPLTPMTGARALSMAALLRELAEVRQQGHSVDDEGVREGVLCIGAPVFDATGMAVAGLGVCVHKALPGAPLDERHRAAVLQAARRLTERLGGQVPASSPASRRPSRKASSR